MVSFSSLQKSSAIIWFKIKIYFDIDQGATQKCKNGLGVKKFGCQHVKIVEL